MQSCAASHVSGNQNQPSVYTMTPGLQHGAVICPTLSTKVMQQHNDPAYNCEIKQQEFNVSDNAANFDIEKLSA